MSNYGKSLNSSVTRVGLEIDIRGGKNFVCLFIFGS